MTGPELRAAMDAAVVVPSRVDLLALALHSAPPAGLACEFGVWRGHSLRHLCALAPDRTFVGFDSLRGLPEPWDVGDGGLSHPEGHFAVDVAPVLPPNAMLVVGAFRDTVPAFFAFAPPPLAFAHVDSDLYSSAKVVLDSAAGHVRPGAVLLFDEIGNWDGRYPTWEQGEWRALVEWCGRTGHAVRPLARTAAQQACFVVEE